MEARVYKGKETSYSDPGRTCPTPRRRPPGGGYKQETSYISLQQIEVHRYKYDAKRHPKYKSGRTCPMPCRRPAMVLFVAGYFFPKCQQVLERSMEVNDHVLDSRKVKANQQYSRHPRQK